MLLPGALLDTLLLWCSLVSLFHMRLPIASFLLLRVLPPYILAWPLLLRTLLVLVPILLSFLRPIAPLRLPDMFFLLARLLTMLRLLSLLLRRPAFLVPGLFLLALLLGTIPLVGMLVPLCVG